MKTRLKLHLLSNKNPNRGDIMKFNFMVSVIKEDDWYVASCLENHVASQGKSREEALVNLQEALELYFEDIDDVPNIEKPFVTTLEIAI